jgi:hypothetical protein
LPVFIIAFDEKLRLGHITRTLGLALCATTQSRRKFYGGYMSVLSPEIFSYFITTQLSLAQRFIFPEISWR